MGNELGCASGEKSTKAQRAEERYLASAPLEGEPPAAASSPANSEEKAVVAAVSSAEAPPPNDGVVEPDVKAESASPGLQAAVSVDAAERPPEVAGTTSSAQHEGEQPPPAEATKVAIAPAVAPPVSEEIVVASVAAPAQLAEAPLPTLQVTPDSSACAAAPVPDVDADPSNVDDDKIQGDVNNATTVASTEVVAVDSTAAACVADVKSANANADDVQQEQPALPAAVLPVESETLVDNTDEAGLLQQPPPEIAICPPCSGECEDQPPEAVAGSIPEAGPDRPVVTVEVTHADELPLTPSREPVIAGPCAAYPGDVETTEMPSDLPEPPACTADAALPADGDSMPPPPPPVAEPDVDDAASDASEAGRVVPPIVINGAGEPQGEAESEDSIAAAVLAAGNRSLELSAPGAERSQPDASKDENVVAAGDGLDCQDKMNGDSEVVSHDCTTPTSPTGADGGAGSQKKIKAGGSSHSRIPVLQGGLHAPTKSK